MLATIVSEDSFVLSWGIAQLSRDNTQMGYRTDVPVQREVRTGDSAPFLGSC